VFNRAWAGHWHTRPGGGKEKGARCYWHNNGLATDYTAGFKGAGWRMKVRANRRGLTSEPQMAFTRSRWSNAR
jgi:hypothetical protein